MTRVLTVDYPVANASGAPVVFAADGDQDLNDLYRLFFMRHGWRVEVCSDGLECLARLRRETPQVLVLDLQLLWGGADGLLAVMRDHPVWSEVPVILTSTDVLPDGASSFASPPVVQALAKPFSLSQLLDSARAQLQKD